MSSIILLNLGDRNEKNVWNMTQSCGSSDFIYMYEEYEPFANAKQLVSIWYQFIILWSNIWPKQSSNLAIWATESAQASRKCR